MNYDEYFKISVEKGIVENIKNTASTFMEAVSEKAEDFGTVTAVDGSYENNMQIVDECVVPTEQEIPIRQYNIARLSTPLWKKAYGRMQITNKRVLFRSVGKSLAGPIMIENEFSMEEIGGVEIKSDYRFNLLTFLVSGLQILLMCGVYGFIFNLFMQWSVKNKSMAPAIILSVLTILATIAVLLLVRRKYMFKSTALNAAGLSLVMIAMNNEKEFVIVLAMLAFIVAFIMWIYSGIVDDLYILIKVKGAVGMIEIGRKLRNDERSGFSIVRPWKDTEIAMREIGALLDDVKRFGDAGINKWKV